MTTDEKLKIINTYMVFVVVRTAFPTCTQHGREFHSRFPEDSYYLIRYGDTRSTVISKVWCDVNQHINALVRIIEDE